MADEDKRNAVGFSVTLSSQLIAAALAMLAVEGAYASYALGSRQITRMFVPLALVAGGLFIISIFVAGKAITAARNAGFTGQWSLDAGKHLFSYQAGLLILALLALGGMFAASGPSKESGLEQQILQLRTDIAQLQQQLSRIPQDQRSYKKELERQIVALTDELKQIRTEVATPSSATPPARRRKGR